MNNNLAELVLVVDRSGSMISCRADAEGGVNSFIKSQQTGDANLTLVEFDTHYDFVCKGVPIQNAPVYKLVPRGYTALYDAVGRAIVETGARLEALPEAERPGCVIVVIVTDGQENRSAEFNRQQIKDMITHQQEKYNWKFTFIGADASTFDTAAGLGLNYGQTVCYDPAKSTKLYATVSQNVSNIRCSCLHAKAADFCYSEEERNAVK
jgi:Mg-chelatase subunit ChlD